MSAVEQLRSAALMDVPHGFLGRKGGRSDGVYEGLNVGLGSSDDAAHVHKNRAIALATVLPGAELVTLHQIHSPDVVTVTAGFADDARPKADALVTGTPGLLLGILTADCVPVLFADFAAGVVGAAHAGWKGAIAGVTDRTLEAMVAIGADRSRIVAAIGPCIGRSSYEVDEAFVARFEKADRDNGRFFAAGKPGHALFDIEAYVAARIAAADVSRVDCLGEDTYSQPDRFFSYRRACHRGEGDYGRQISLIGIPGITPMA